MIITHIIQLRFWIDHTWIQDRQSIEFFLKKVKLKSRSLLGLSKSINIIKIYQVNSDLSKSITQAIQYLTRID